MKIFTFNFWVQAFTSAFITMVCFYVLKKLSGTMKIPVVNEIIDNA